MKIFHSDDIGEAIIKFTLHLDDQKFSNLVDKIRLHDRYYVLPKKSSIHGSFSSNLFEFFKSTGMWKAYKEEGMDCDNYAECARAWAVVKHNISLFKDVKEIPNADIAFGCVSYTPDGGEYHRANFFITKEKGELKVYGYEPQSCKIFEFTKTEIESITHLDL